MLDQHVQVFVASKAVSKPVLKVFDGGTHGAPGLEPFAYVLLKVEMTLDRTWIFALLVFEENRHSHQAGEEAVLGHLLLDDHQTTILNFLFEVWHSRIAI